jgi:hypothetical protein
LSYEQKEGYYPNTWENYTLEELGMWVHLLVKRSEHRTDKTKAEKDAYDASRYLEMMQQHVIMAQANARDRLV